MILFRSFLRPISVAELVSVLSQLGQHHDDDAPLLPNHLPEVGYGVGHGTLRNDVGRVPGVVIHNSGAIDVVRVGSVDQSIQQNPVVIVGQLVGVAVLLLILYLYQSWIISFLNQVLSSYLESDAGSIRLGLVSTEANPLLLQSLLVLEVILHVGEDHVAR